MYPLLVACKSQSSFRRSAAMAVVDNVRTHAATLVEQAQLVRPFQSKRLVLRCLPYTLVEQAQLVRPFQQ